MERICPVCKQAFETYSASTQKFCSRKCYLETHVSSAYTVRPCKHCNQNFKPKGPGQKFCSRACYLAERRLNGVSKIRCVRCGKEFKPKVKSQKYCSWNCYAEAQRKPAQTCEVCGKEFPYRRGSVNRFCSYECAHIGKRNRIIKTCPVCGNEFEVVASRAYQHTCSWECGKKRRHRFLTCEMCGKTIEVQAHVIEGDHYAGRFCSYECAAKWQKAENHSNWQGGHEKWRGPNWEKQRVKALERDGYTCQRCNISEDELGHSLNVHHIRPWREFNGDWKSANVLSNLVSLCPPCHTSIEPRGH